MTKNAKSVSTSQPIGNAVFVVDEHGCFKGWNQQALSLEPSMHGELGELVEDPAALKRAIRQAMDSGQSITLDDDSQDDAYEASPSLRITPLGGAKGLALIEIRASEELGRLEEAARINDERVRRLSDQLALVSKELVDKTAQLAEQKSKTDAIIDGMDEGLLGCDEQGEIVQFNAVAARLLSISRPLSGDRRINRVSPAAAEAAGFDPNNPSSIRKQSVNLTLNGREIRLFVSPIHEDERFVGFVVILLDRSRQAELDRLKADLISIVSHEMRSPLTSIKGYVDLIMSGDLGKPPDWLESYLSVVSNNANRLSALIDDMLDLSRLESGQLSMDFSKVDVGYLCEMAYLNHKPQAEKKSISLSRRADDSLAVSGDIDRLQQAVSNLVSNAVKYTPEGGVVTIQARAVGDWVEIEVSDNGFGISSADQEKLFQKFFRVKSKQTRRIGGTGLGLCIVRTIVEAHHGEVSVRSTEGEGSVFLIRLPGYHG